MIAVLYSGIQAIFLNGCCWSWVLGASIWYLVVVSYSVVEQRSMFYAYFSLRVLLGWNKYIVREQVVQEVETECDSQ